MRRLLLRAVVLLALLFLSSAAKTQGQNLFFQPPTYPGSGQTVMADFNGDGKPDLIRADGTVLLGNGDGTFAEATPFSLGIKGVFVGTITTADFNGDGKPDLLVTTFPVFTLAVLLGNGDGTFQPPISTNIGTSLTSILVADVNGDGKPDAVGFTASQILVFLGKGGGTFAPGVAYSPFGSSPVQALTIADFNGDGKLDIAAAGYVANAIGPVGVLLGNGDGTFQAPIVSTGVNSPQGMVARDFNGDGKVDLVISDEGPTGTNETYTLLGNGDGSFQAPSSPIPGAGVLAATDLNGDGKLDLVVWGNPFVEIFLGNGNGTFTAKSTYLDADFQAQATIAIADFNADGKLDLAAGGLLLLGNGDGTFQDNPAFLINIPPLDVPVLNSVTTADFNGDGKPDIAVALQGVNPSLYILLGDGAGNFSIAHNYALPSSAYTLKTADFNADGKVDLFFTTAGSTSNIGVMLGNGDGTFAAPVFSPLGLTNQTNPVPTVIADFNGDHIPDVAAITNGQLTVFLGKGDGTFGPPASSFAGSEPNSLAAADFNNDGNTDAVVCGSAGLGVLLGKGDGTFQPATFPNPPPPPSQGVPPTAPATGCLLLAAADFNGDGVVDLFIGAVLLGNGDGTFTPLLQQIDGLGFNITVADINGDGKLDLVGSQGVSVALGNGDGTFGGTITVMPPENNGQILSGPTDSEAVFAVADFNGDHRPDVALVLSAYPGGVVTLLNTSPPPSPDFLIAASLLAPASVPPGSSAGSSVTLTPVGGFSEGVALSCAGLPAGAGCSFAPSSLPAASGKSTLTITTVAATPVGTYPVLIVGTSSSLVHERVITLTVATSAGATNAHLLPEILTFAQQMSGTSSPAQVTTLTNTGNAALTLSSVSIAGANARDFAATNACGSSIPAFASCQISVTFTPTGMGTRSATLSVNDNATGSPQMIDLSGTGQDFSLSPGSTATASVTPGQTATYSMSLTAGGGFNGKVTLTCAGAPSMSTCLVSPSTISLNSTSAATATVTVTTTAASQVLFPVGISTPGGLNDRLAPILLCLLAMLMIASLYISRRDQRFRWAAAVALGVLLCVGMTLTSCGGGSSGGSGGGGGSTGTQAGTYTITVTASATSGSTTLTHSTKLTLVVQ